jgi:two-component system, sensor histidine kinase and response regulator
METSKGKILIVDDNPTNIQVVGNILTEKGFDIAFAQSGEKAIEQVLHTDYDLILLDIMMPEKDGFEICESLKANPQTKEIPIVYLTAKSDIDSIIRGLRNGGIDYISKPFIKEELIGRVENQIKMKKIQDELVFANRSKDKFFSIIAHDLKSPISAFKNITDVLVRDYEDFDREDIYDFVKKLNESAGNVYKLLDDLLEWSRNQNNKITFDPSLILLSKLSENIIDLLGNNIERKELEVVNKIDEDIKVYADLNMINTVLRNLISNAIKFTQIGGKIEVGCSDYDEDSMIVWVKDNGVGMQQSDIEKLFKIEIHHTTHGTDEEVGTGLGLILCQDFILKHNGKIWVESVYGEGSTFFFTIPKVDVNNL